MRVAVGTVEVGDELRLAIRTLEGRTGLATRAEAREWMNEKLRIEIEGALEVAAEIRADARRNR